MAWLGTVSRPLDSSGQAQPEAEQHQWLGASFGALGERFIRFHENVEEEIRARYANPTAAESHRLDHL